MGAATGERIGITTVNAADAREFTDLLGAIYEHSPWVAARAAVGRPFAGVGELHAAMQRIVMQADRPEQLALIRAHPQLRGRLASAEQLTRASQSEQASAGLDRCTPEQLERLQGLNQAYAERHGFPFVVAVRGLGTADIIARMEQRLPNETDQEFRACLREIGCIARFRLDDLIQG
jgi:2-oxo-4-hydroxy-4-carboxy-5-ureidoimidazoline decarboxylase